RVVVVIGGPVLGQLIQQLRLRYGAVFAEVVDFLGEASAEKVSPHAVDKSLGKVRTADDTLRQFLATGAFQSVWELGSVEEESFGVLDQAAAALVGHKSAFVVARVVTQFILLVICCFFVLVAVRPPAYSFHLTQVGVYAPEMLLAPFVVKWVIVALRAL